MAFQSSTQELPVTDIAEAYRGGATLIALAVKHNSSPATIARRLRESGVTLRPKGSPRRQMSTRDWGDLAAIAGMLADGSTLADVARSFDVSRQAVHQQLAALCRRAAGETAKPR